jgi:hypothetical protein
MTLQNAEKCPVTSSPPVKPKRVQILEKKEVITELVRFSSAVINVMMVTLLAVPKEGPIEPRVRVIVHKDEDQVDRGPEQDQEDAEQQEEEEEEGSNISFVSLNGSYHHLRKL